MPGSVDLFMTEKELFRNIRRFESYDFSDTGKNEGSQSLISTASASSHKKKMKAIQIFHKKVTESSYKGIFKYQITETTIYSIGKIKIKIEKRDTLFELLRDRAAFIVSKELTENHDIR
jgi:hypothetical protein